MRKQFIEFCQSNNLKLTSICFVLAIAVMTSVLCIATSYHYAKLLSGELTVVDGFITAVYTDGRTGEDGFRVFLNGNEYELSKPRYPRKTYGIRNDISIASYGEKLREKTGMQAHIGYVQLAPNSKIILRFITNGVPYIDEDVARNDHVEYHTNIAHIAEAVLLLCIVCLMFLLSCIRLQGR